MYKLDFGSSFLEWSYLEKSKGAHQGDPISPYLFNLALKILFYTIKTNQNIEGLDICYYSFLYSAYADDTTLFSKNLKSVMELDNTIDYFSHYSGLNSDISKCEIASVGALKGVLMAVCCLKPVDLTSDTLKIPAIYFYMTQNIIMK